MANENCLLFFATLASNHSYERCNLINNLVVIICLLAVLVTSSETEMSSLVVDFFPVHCIDHEEIVIATTGSPKKFGTRIIISFLTTPSILTGTFLNLLLSSSCPKLEKKLLCKNPSCSTNYPMHLYIRLLLILKSLSKTVTFPLSV